MSWNQTYQLLFAHCDPAGIAYYPKLFELLDGAIEQWTAEIIGIPRHVMHGQMERGMPTVTLSSRFSAPSFHGDLLEMTLTLTALGRSSIDFTIDVSCEAEQRFAVDYRQVFVDQASRRSVVWPDDIRVRLEEAI